MLVVDLFAAYLHLEQGVMALDECGGAFERQADSVRDAMDPLWRSLSDEEHGRLNDRGDASADLLIIDDPHAGQHWLEVAAGRMLAGEPEADVMRDYGWERR